MKAPKCIVHGCTKYMDQGKFIGDLCKPCYTYITTGKVGPTDSFLSRIKDDKPKGKAQ